MAQSNKIHTIGSHPPIRPTHTDAAHRQTIQLQIELSLRQMHSLQCCENCKSYECARHSRTHMRITEKHWTAQDREAAHRNSAQTQCDVGPHNARCRFPSRRGKLRPTLGCMWMYGMRKHRPHSHCANRAFPFPSVSLGASRALCVSARLYVRLCLCVRRIRIWKGKCMQNR